MRKQEVEVPYEKLFTGAPFGYVVLAADQRIAAANRMAVRLLALSGRGRRKMRFCKYIHRADRQSFQLWCSSALTTGRSQSGDLRIRNGSGDELFAHLKLQPQNDGCGKETSLLLALIDITDRKRTEAELTAQRDNLTGILNAMEDGVYIVNDRHQIEYINPALRKEFGASENRKCYEYFHGRRSACPWCKNEAVFSGQTVRWDWHSAKTGKTYDLVDTPLKKADGSILKLEIFRDITDRKHAESALQESEERFRVAFETSPNAIAISEIDTAVIVSVNQGFTDFTGYSKQAVEGKSSVDIPIWADPRDRERMLLELRRTGEINNLEAEFQTRTGKIKTGLVSGRVIRLHDRPYLLSVTRDISELKKTRKKLEASQRFLQIVNRQSQMVLMLEEFIERIRATSGCGAVGIRILDPRGSIPFAAFRGYSSGFCERENSITVRDAGAMCVRVIEQRTDSQAFCYTPGGSFFCNHSSRFLKSAAAAEAKWHCSVCNDYGYESIALIPLRLGGRVLGLIHVADTGRNMVPVDMVEVLEDAAMQLAAAIQRLRAEEGLRQSNEQLEQRVQERTAELAEANRQLTEQIAERRSAEAAMEKSQNELRILSSRLLSAEEHERKRIAGELHDGIGQALSAIKFGMENVLRDLEQHGAVASLDTLKALIPLTRHTIEEVRSICKDLRPSILDDLGILATIGWFCREFSSLYASLQIQPELDIEENEIPVRLKTVIYRILQEALNNVAKHSGASGVQVGLKRSKSGIYMWVADNGIGFDPEQALSLQSQDRGIGLASMRERAELTNGDFQLISEPGGGTQIRVCWPVQPDR